MGGFGKSIWIPNGGRSSGASLSGSAEVKRRLGGWEWLGGVELVEGFGVVVGVRVFDFEEGGGIEGLESDTRDSGSFEVEEDLEVYEVGGSPDLEVDEAASVTDVAEGQARGAVDDGDRGSAGGAGVSGEGVGADGEFDKEVEAVVVVVLTKFVEEGVKVVGEEFGGTDVGRVVCNEAAALVFRYGRSRSSVDGRRARERCHRLGRSTVVAEGGEEGIQR